MWGMSTYQCTAVLVFINNNISKNSMALRSRGSDQKAYQTRIMNIKEQGQASVVLRGGPSRGEVKF